MVKTVAGYRCSRHGSSKTSRITPCHATLFWQYIGERTRPASAHNGRGELSVALHIPQLLYEELCRHGEENYPLECCGALVGEFAGPDKHVRRVVRCANAHKDARTRYQISPVELFRIQHEAAKDELEIVGFYHSHPGHPAQWSATDLAEAYWTGCSYVITRVDQGQAGATCSFLLTGGETDKKLEDEPLLVAGNSGIDCE